MTELSSRPARSESREIAELRKLRLEQPELESAIDLQIELLQVQRRVQARVSLPSIRLETEYLTDRLASPPILAFEHLPLDWGDVRFLLRATGSAMRSHDAIEDGDYRRVEALARESERLPPVVEAWYAATGAKAAHADQDVLELGVVLLQVMRPFLTRSAEAVMAKIDLSPWQRGGCPVCGGDPDLAVITPAADRLLICGRCLARWRFDQITCPFCLNADRSGITSFASRDGQYRLYGCDRCQRYVKAFDARRATRPVMPAVDSIATLPLDAAALQRGYK